LIAAFVARADYTISFPASPWMWQVFGYADDLWMRSYSNGVAQFDFRIGAGGCLAEMRACYLGYQALLCPAWVNSAQPGRDNVLQWVMWAGATTDGTTDAGANWYKRWNINQAGGYDGFAPLASVNISATTQSCAITVLAANDEQFMAGYDDIFRTTSWPDWVAQSVRYDLLDKGALKITHASLIPVIHRNNTVVPVNSTPGNFTYAYFENWSTFYAATNGLFNGLARHLAADGAPDWWFRFRQNIPVYQYESLTNTAGYAVAFNIGGHANGTWPVVGVVFGKQNTVTTGNTGGGAMAVMNFFEAQGASGLGYVAILPACQQNLPVPGSTVVCETFLVPRAASSAEFVNDLNQFATSVAAPAIYAPGQAPAAFTNLAGLVPWESAWRVEHLAPAPTVTGCGFTNQVFAMNGTGLPGLSYRVESSSNLVDWAQVQTGNLTGGVFQFSETVAPDVPRRFYRLAAP
jgi:hypothetical protein